MFDMYYMILVLPAIILALVAQSKVQSTFKRFSKQGNIKSSVLLNGNIESSPAVFNNVLVVATRNGTIYGVKVK